MVRLEIVVNFWHFALQPKHRLPEKIQPLGVKMRRLESKTTNENVHAFSSFALFPAHPWLLDGELLAFCLATKT